jgi:hypothetical protein
MGQVGVLYYTTYVNNFKTIDPIHNIIKKYAGPENVIMECPNLIRVSLHWVGTSHGYILRAATHMTEHALLNTVMLCSLCRNSIEVESFNMLMCICYLKLVILSPPISLLAFRTSKSFSLYYVLINSFIHSNFRIHITIKGQTCDSMMSGIKPGAPT